MPIRDWQSGRPESNGWTNSPGPLTYRGSSRRAASLVEAKELVEDSLAVDPGAVTAAVDGPPLRSVTARRRAAEIISKLINKTKKKNIAYLTGGALAAFM